MAIAGKRLEFRSTASNFEASLRVVRTNLGVAVIAREVAKQYAEMYGLKVIPLTDAWARRNDVIYYRGREYLSRAALMLSEFLGSRAARG